jgi:hypothetical protein
MVAIGLLTVFRKTRSMISGRLTERSGRSRPASVTTEACGADLGEAGVMTGSHTRWARPESEPEDPERIAIRKALAFGKAVYDRRVALDLSVADLAARGGMTRQTSHNLIGRSTTASSADPPLSR